MYQRITLLSFICLGWLAELGLGQGPPQVVPAAVARQAVAVGGTQVTLSVRISVSQQPRFVLTHRFVETEALVPEAFQAPPEMIDHFESMARTQIAAIDECCHLDDKQKSKLALAAMGDLSRVVREARRWQEKYTGISTRDQATMAVASDELATLSQRLREGILRTDSIYHRVAMGLLSDQQRQALARARLVERLDRWHMSLSEDQKQELLRLLLAQSQRVIDPPILWEPGHCVSLIQSLDQAELSKFLDASQIETIRSFRKPDVKLSF